MKWTIAIDFDWVIHKYSKWWHDWTIYDNPIDWAFEYIEQLIKEWYSVFIHSTRSPRKIKQWLEPLIMVSAYEHYWPGESPFDYRWTRYWYTCEVINFFSNWFSKFWNKQGVLWITNKKLPAIAYIDDRAVRFEWNFNNIKFRLWRK